MSVNPGAPDDANVLSHGPQTRIDAYDVDRAWFIPVVRPFAPYYAAVEPTPTRN
jgi:hypothetical protein